MSEKFKVVGTDLEIHEDELNVRSFSSLKVGELLSSHLFHKVGKRLFMLQAAGNIIEQKFLNHYLDKKLIDVYCYEVANSGVIISGQDILKSWKKASTHEERLESRKEFLSWFKRMFWDGETKSSLLDLVAVMYHQFYKLPEHVYEQMQSTSVIIYNRSLLMAAYSVVIGASLGVVDIEILRDLYHTTILLDYGLLGPMFNYRILKACELEHNKSLSGLEYLKANGTSEEYDYFYFHPLTGATQARLDCDPIASIGNIYNLIELHHERREGKGFPKNVQMIMLSELDQIVIFVDSIIDFDLERYAQTDGMSHFKKIFEKYDRNKLNEIPCKRVYMKLKSYFEQFPFEESEVA